MRRRVVDFDELLASARSCEVPRIGPRVTGRDRPVLLVVDQRLCMFFGTGSLMKSVVAARMAALAAWRIVAAGNRVGAMVVGEHRHWSVRLARSNSNVLRLLEHLVTAGRALEGCRPAPNDPFRSALEAIAELELHDTLVFVISDLRGISAEAGAALARVRRDNDVLLAWVVDPLEVEPPHAQGAASDPDLCAAFAAAFEQDQARVQELCLKAAAPYFQLRTDRPLLDQVAGVLEEHRTSVGQAG
jgi:uncharacterized protein (DUF58 family)